MRRYSVRSSSLWCRERPRQRAAVDRLEHGRLDLDEAPLVEPAAHLADHLRPQDEQLARLLVGHQVELAVAVAQLDVGEAVMLLGRWAQRLREHAEVHAQRQLTAAGAQHAALCADQIAEVEAEQALERLLAEVVDARHQLMRPERSTTSRNAACCSRCAVSGHDAPRSSVPARVRVLRTAP
jgi:hypothetical protein